MKVRNCSLHVVEVPYDGTRTGTHLVLRLYTDSGVEGFGYTSVAGSPRWTLKPLMATAEALVELIAGQDPLNNEAVNAKLASPTGLLTGVVHAAAALIDVALWDIRGKALGAPVYQLLGGHTDRVRAYGGWKLWSQLDLDTVAGNARWFAEQGFSAIKLRLGGINEPAVAAERLRIIRDAAGPDMDLLVDVNQGWDVKQTLRIAPYIEEHRLFYLEDPIPHTDYDGLTQIAQAIETPLAAGENYSTGIPFRELLERRGLDVVMVDLHVGGLTQWMKIAHMAEVYGKPVVSHLCPEVLAHAIAAIPNGVILEYLPWAHDLFKEPPVVKDGYLQLTSRPGLGWELDEAALKKFAVQ